MDDSSAPESFSVASRPVLLALRLTSATMAIVETFTAVPTLESAELPAVETTGVSPVVTMPTITYIYTAAPTYIHATPEIDVAPIVETAAATDELSLEPGTAPTLAAVETFARAPEPMAEFVAVGSPMTLLPTVTYTYTLEEWQALTAAPKTGSDVPAAAQEKNEGETAKKVVKKVKRCC